MAKEVTRRKFLARTAEYAAVGIGSVIGWEALKHYFPLPEPKPIEKPQPPLPDVKEAPKEKRAYEVHKELSDKVRKPLDVAKRYAYKYFEGEGKEGGKGDLKDLETVVGAYKNAAAIFEDHYQRDFAAGKAEPLLMEVACNFRLFAAVMGLEKSRKTGSGYETALSELDGIKAKLPSETLRLGIGDIDAWRALALSALGRKDEAVRVAKDTFKEGAVKDGRNGAPARFVIANDTNEPDAISKVGYSMSMLSFMSGNYGHTREKLLKEGKQYTVDRFVSDLSPSEEYYRPADQDEPFRQSYEWQGYLKYITGLRHLTPKTKAGVEEAIKKDEKFGNPFG